ncbi:MAG: DNA sulfur modification protein DndB [Aestuariivirga sp.]|uniref:DNA sulfur modification protein DndB n=1 Tax=Aestuariivirga sp. TaxID=2650926 RepID=UPI0038D19A43
MEAGTLRSVRSRQTYPAMSGKHGPRLATYATQINPLDVITVLGHDPRSDKRRFLTDQKIVELYDYMQRKTTGQRKDAIKHYIEDRLFPQSDLIGGFPAISIAVQYPITSEEISSAFPGVVNMSIDTGVHNKRVALDGLGRLSGALAWVDVALSGELTDAESAELQSALEDIAIPCVFYSPRPGQHPLTAEEMGQLFHDFNFKVTPVSAKDAIALDQSDPYIRATYNVAKNSQFIAKFGMDTRAASLGSKSKAIVVQPVLLRFIRAALEGQKYVEAARNTEISNPHLTAKSAPQVLGALTDFVDNFAEAMGHRWYDRNSIHLSSGGWQALGIIYHDVTFRLKNIDRAAFARTLATKIDWRRDAEIWNGLTTVKKDKKGNEATVLLGAGASLRREIVKRIRDATGLTTMLAELQDGEE